MNTHHTSNCLNDETLHEAAAGHELPPEVREHLQTCQGCRERTDSLAQVLSVARPGLNACIEEAVSQFRMPPLPARAVKRPGNVWNLFITPVPAYLAAVLLLVVALPLALHTQRGGLDMGGVKAIRIRTSSQDDFASLYAPNPKDAAALLGTIYFVEQYGRTHTEDVSIHVKLTQLYTALLALKGWESDTHTRAHAVQRLAQERKAVRQALPVLSGDGGRN